MRFSMRPPTPMQNDQEKPYRLRPGTSQWTPHLPGGRVADATVERAQQTNAIYPDLYTELMLIPKALCGSFEGGPSTLRLDKGPPGERTRLSIGSAFGCFTRASRERLQAE
jgi:hypothetical protein